MLFVCRSAVFNLLIIIALTAALAGQVQYMTPAKLGLHKGQVKLSGQSRISIVQRRQCCPL